MLRLVFEGRSLKLWWLALVESCDSGIHVPDPIWLLGVHGLCTATSGPVMASNLATLSMMPLLIRRDERRESAFARSVSLIQAWQDADAGLESGKVMKVGVESELSAGKNSKSWGPSTMFALSGSAERSRRPRELEKGSKGRPLMSVGNGISPANDPANRRPWPAASGDMRNGSPEFWSVKVGWLIGSAACCCCALGLVFFCAVSWAAALRARVYS